MVSSGLNQFNVVVPVLEDGDYLVTASQDGYASASKAWLTVKK